MDIKIQSDTYQIRYDSNKELHDLFFEKFSFSYKFLKVVRKKGNLEGKKVFTIVPRKYAEFIDFISTGKPFEYEIKLNPFKEGKENDDEYQKEIETSLQDKITEFEYLSKIKPSKAHSNRRLNKRYKVVGRNAIVTANSLNVRLIAIIRTLLLL